jgi:beta-N-acetylhexosaminidase
MKTKTQTPMPFNLKTLNAELLPLSRRKIFFSHRRQSTALSLPVPSLLARRVREGFALILLALLLAATPAAAQPTPIESRLASLTLEQKVAQMFLGVLYGPTLNAPGRDFLAQWQPGGVVIFNSNAGNPEEVTRLTNSWQQTVVDAGGVPMFITTDQEGGTIARLKDGFTEWPVPMLLTASGDVDLAYRVGQAMANELKAVGLNMNLAPVADLYTNLRNPVIGRRSFGSDPERTGRMLAALIRGMQANGILATAKHFPGHGDTDRDSHTSLPIVQYPREELERVEFAPFRWTIAAGVESMMVAHIWYPALDSEQIPSSLSRNIITGLLREDMAFRGLIMTDAIEMDAIDTVYSYSEASIMAINAGVDIVALGAHLTPNQQSQAMQAVVDAVRRGEISEARINQSVSRILSAKERYGILDWTPLEPSGAGGRMRSAEHAALVAEVFRAGVTVAYDRNETLPLEDSKRVALVYPGTRQKIKQSCEKEHPSDMTMWVSVAETPTEDQINSAVRAANTADVVVVFTQNAGTDRMQQALVRALPREKTVAVALFSPYDWQSFPDVSAYLTTYSPLEPGIPAVCEVLFGAIPARGQLPLALDGQRDFASFVATEGITINVADSSVSLVARQTVAQTPTLLPTLTSLPPTWSVSETPMPTLTATETRAPLLSSTRSVAMLADNSPLPDTSTSATLLPPEPSAAPAPPLFPFIAVIFGGVIGFGLFLRSQQQGKRRSFVIERCPVCKEGKLRVSKRAVHCDVCHSVLRESGRGRWKYRINQHRNPSMYQRFNDKILDEDSLRLLERETN